MSETKNPTRDEIKRAYYAEELTRKQIAERFGWNSTNALDYHLNLDPPLRKRDDSETPWGMEHDLTLDQLLGSGVLKGKNFEDDVAEAAMRLEFRASAVRDRLRPLWEQYFTTQEQEVSMDDMNVMLAANNSAAATALQLAQTALQAAEDAQTGLQMVSDSMALLSNKDDTALKGLVNDLCTITFGDVPLTFKKLSSQAQPIELDGDMVLLRCSLGTSISPLSGPSKVHTGWSVKAPEGYHLMVTPSTKISSDYSCQILESPIVFPQADKELVFTLVNHTAAGSVNPCNLNIGTPLALLTLLRTNKVALIDATNVEE